MKKSVVLTVISLCLLALPALASVTLRNTDSDSHEITITCSSTAISSIGGSSSRDIGTGPCTVTVKSTGNSATANDGETLVISGGNISK